MEKMKKMLGVQSSKKNNDQAAVSGSSSTTSTGSQYFGVPLSVLIKREHSTVPHLVVKVCIYLFKNGLDSEGVFRVNGSSLLVEALRDSFNEIGDADFEKTGDIMAVASLLKMFLRDLPDGLIPEHLTSSFIAVQEEYGKQPDIYFPKIRELLQKLPQPEYQTLKYLVQFLVILTKKSATNKMDARALGIVFGPNLFRCSYGVQGLKEQGLTNYITRNFITDYDRLFLEEGEQSPYSPGFLLKNKPNGSLPQESCVPKLDLPSEDAEKNANNNQMDEDFLDTNRSNSPFALESDRSEYSTLTSPRLVSARNSIVEKVISTAVDEILFGECDQNLEDGTSKSATHSGPVPAPRQKRKQNEKIDSSAVPVEKDAEHEKISVKERIQQLQMKGAAPVQETDQTKKPKQRPQVLSKMEQKGLVYGSTTASNLKSLIKNRQNSDEEDDGSGSTSAGSPKFTAASKHSHPDTPSPDKERSTGWNDLPDRLDLLPAFKRARGPGKRHRPTYRKQQQQQTTTQMETNVSSTNNEENEGPPQPRQFLAETQSKSDVNHNATKPSMSFLNEREQTSPDKSPVVNRKPYVPPLDLSILHEHVDGSEPIPAEQGYSISLQKANQYKDGEAAMLSPRTSKLKSRKNQFGYIDNHDRCHRPCHLGYQMRPYLSAHPNTDVPPSPPTDQTHIQSKRNIDDENVLLVRQLTKKIQSCKKKIKTFEESFEQTHGYRPSQTDKAAVPEVKRNMQELQKARKELRRVKEEIEDERRARVSSPSGLAVLPNGRTTHDDEIPSSEKPPNMEETLQLLLRKLEEKRAECNRPENLAEQTREEIVQEKLAVQKALLHFESIHGRPTTKAEKTLMRPLYDRYRNIKRILSKVQSPRDKSMELQSVPEGQALEFTQTPSTAESSKREPVHVPTADEEPEDFMVTKDFHLMRGDTLYPGGRMTSVFDGPSQNLHELSVSELLEEQHKAKADKKRLRKIIKEFEEDFLRQTGSKVQKEDRAPLEAEYHEYKEVKAKLKLLEALLSKHDPLSAY